VRRSPVAAAPGVSHIPALTSGPRTIGPGGTMKGVVRPRVERDDHGCGDRVPTFL